LFDETDLKIIALLQEDPRLHQAEIAKSTGLSQSTIALRLEKMRNEGLFRNSAGFDLAKVKKAPVYMVSVDTKDIPAVLKWAQSSPNFVNAFVTLGGYPLTMIFVTKDIESFSKQVEQEMRSNGTVKGFEVKQIASVAKEYMVHLPNEIVNVAV
jgi:DNA-binding Lrp family transcriptional regulator